MVQYTQTRPTQLIIFSDLDGSLLDHNSYRWEAANEALAMIREHGIPLIPCSSKTFDEIHDLVQRLSLRQPFIFENGCGVAIPDGYFDQHGGDEQRDGYSVHFLGSRVNFIHDILARINKDGNYRYELFSTLGEERVTELTGLDKRQAIRATQRLCSEPLLWLDSDEALTVFTEQLQRYGMKLLSGGRFHTVTESADKGKAIKWLLKQFQQSAPQTRFTTLGLGDSANDIQMFHAVDHSILIRNPEIDQLDIGEQQGLSPTEQAGPAGWNHAVLNFIGTH